MRLASIICHILTQRSHNIQMNCLSPAGYCKVLFRFLKAEDLRKELLTPIKHTKRLVPRQHTHIPCLVTN